MSIALAFIAGVLFAAPFTAATIVYYKFGTNYRPAMVVMGEILSGCWLASATLLVCAGWLS